MIDIILLGFLATFLYTPYGYLIQKGNNIRSFSLQLIFSLIILSFLALILNFFTPLTKIICSSFILLSLLIIAKFRHIFLKKKYLFFCSLSSIIIFLLITSSNVYRPDAGLYHLPFISILNNEKIIFGLSNLHFRYGHISIIQYTSAIFNNIIFQDRGINFPAALIAMSVILNFSSNLNYKLKLRQFDFHFFILFSFIIFIFYKVNRFSEYGNDAPTHLLMFLLISEIVNNFKVSDNSKFSDYLLLSLFIIMNKIILLLSFLFPLILFLNRKIKIKIFELKNIFILIFIILWFSKNIIISGCMLFPVKNTCLGYFQWTNVKEAERVSVENEAWAKGWPDFRKGEIKLSQKDYSKNFNWVNTWSKNHLIKILNIIVPYILFLMIILLLVRKTTAKLPHEKYIKYLFYISLLGTILWIYKVPVFRYGYSYLVILISLIFSYFAQSFKFKENSKSIFKASILLLATVFILKNSNRIIFENKQYYDYPWPKIYSMNENNKPKMHNFKYIGGKKIYYAADNYCMYGLSPCGLSTSGIKHRKILGYSLIYKSLN